MLEFGRTVADAVMAIRAVDGADNEFIEPGNTGIGQWRALPPNIGGLNPQWGDVTPWALERGDQFRPDGPPDLTSAEYDLLRVFTERPNRVLSRDDLVDSLKGFERDPFDRSIDIRVTRLRRNIETDPGAPAYVRTVRGEGYLFNPLGEKS